MGTIIWFLPCETLLAVCGVIAGSGWCLHTKYLTVPHVKIKPNFEENQQCGEELIRYLTGRPILCCVDGFQGICGKLLA